MPTPTSIPSSNGNGQPARSKFTELLARLDRFQPALPDPREDCRALVRVISALATDSPERQALLHLVGLSPGALSPAQCLDTAAGLLDHLTQEDDHFPKMWESRERREEPLSRSSPGFITRPLSEVVPREVHWLWPQRIPLGKLTILSGDPGLGKTFMVLDLISRITTGRPLPDGPNPLGVRKDVLWVSAEDADDDTVRPRLDLLGGDPTRVHSMLFVVERVTDKGSKNSRNERRILNLTHHLDLLEDWLHKHPAVILVTLDPLTAFLGDTDTHRDKDVRQALHPLAELAERRRVSILGINHLNKGQGTSAVYRGMGSIAFVAGARAGWQLTRDPNPKAPDRRLLLEVKVNNKDDDTVRGLAFRIGKTHGGISWEKGEVTTTADQALAPVPPTPKRPAADEAWEWFKEQLKDGSIPSDALWELATANGLCKKTIRNALKARGIRPHKTKTGWTYVAPP